MKFLVYAAGCLLASGIARAGTILFDDLSNPNFSIISMTGSSYGAVQLDTDGNTYTVTQATLVLQSVVQIITTQNTGHAMTTFDESIGMGQLSIYDATGSGGQPVNNLGTFSGPPSLTTTLSDNVFTDSGIVLQPHTEYWLIFQVTEGTVNWGIDVFGSPGTGPLFDSAYSTGTVAADDFFGEVNYPSQTQLVGTVSTPSAGTPEPGTIWVTLTGLGAVALRRFSKRA